LIQTQLVLGWSAAALAAALQRAHSTATREMARNGWRPSPALCPRGRPRVAGGCWVASAQQFADDVFRNVEVVGYLLDRGAIFVVLDNRGCLHPVVLPDGDAAELFRALWTSGQPDRLMSTDS